MFFTSQISFRLLKRQSAVKTAFPIRNNLPYLYLKISYIYVISICINLQLQWASLVAQMVKKKKTACNAGEPGLIPGLGSSLEKEMATYSSIFPQKIPWTEEPGSLQQLPRQLSGKESACQCRRPRLDPWVGKIPWRRKWQPTLVFLPGKSHGREAWQYTVHRIAESNTTEHAP